MNGILLYILICSVWTVYAMDARRRIRKSARDAFFDTALNNFVLCPFAFVLSISSGMLRDDLSNLVRAVKDTYMSVR